MKPILHKRVLQHIAFWTFYLVIYTINYTFAPYVKDRTIGESIIFLPSHLFFTYCQMYWLVPQYLLRKRIIKYFAFSLLVLAVALTYSRWAGSYFLGFHPYVNNWFTYYLIGYGRAAFSFLPIAGLAVSIKLYRNWLSERERALKAEKDKVKMELDILRSQLHPHFLFNTLNNLYSLTLSSSAAASTVVLNLSDLLRYILYECEGATVALDKELKVLKKYVELEKLRYGNRLDVAFTVSGNTCHLGIAPLLLLPFIENSFKHSTSNQLEQCWINIHAHVEGDRFHFQVNNSRSEKSPGIVITGGIGLHNVRKRLALLYQGKHDLSIIEKEELYSLKMHLQLEKLQEPSQPVIKDLFKPETITT